MVVYPCFLSGCRRPGSLDHGKQLPYLPHAATTVDRDCPSQPASSPPVPLQVLNALAIDPGRTWKGPWRWFDESMLECCEPLEVRRTPYSTCRSWLRDGGEEDAQDGMVFPRASTTAHHDQHAASEGEAI